MTDADAALWAELTRPFAPEDVEKLPKNVRRDDQDRGTCAQGSRYSADGTFCGKYHGRAVHLDYVGHAGITMRLNHVVGPAGWNFEAFAHDSDGLPVIGRQFYAKLTILGVTKWDLADNFSSAQEAYGDALRRCAMRFGIGTYLWSKSESAATMATEAPAQTYRPPTPGETLLSELNALPEGVAALVRQNWPAGLGDPTTLDAEQCEAVRVVIKTAQTASMEE